MKTNDKPILSKQRIISRCVLSALALLGAADALANKDFASVPFYLDSKTQTTGVKVKPNVMLLIDDSGSMTQPVGNQGSRMRVTINALNKVLDKYTNQINWGFQTLNNNDCANYFALKPNQQVDSQNECGHGKNVHSSKISGLYTDDHTIIKDKVNNRLRAYHGTPTTRRYYEVSWQMRDHAKLRCEKNYIVVMSDGNANLSCQWNPQLTYPLRGSQDLDFFGTKNAGFCYNDGGNYDTEWDRKDGLRFFSSALFNKDFRTTGIDAAGKSWNGDANDPKDKNGKSIYEKQNIETFTVGFGDTLTKEGHEYLQRGAATSLDNGYFNASSAQDLEDAFGRIFSNIDAANSPIAISAPGSAAPALTNPGASSSAVVVDLDSGSWSSRLKFYEVGKDGKVDTSSYTQPSFNNRKTILNDGKNNYLVDSIDNRAKTNDDFAISGGKAGDGLEWKKVLLPWTARIGDDASLKKTAKDTYDKDYRDRTKDSNGAPVTGKRDLGDILDSSVQTIGDLDNGRNKYLVTAANDGMVHLFQSAPGSHPYDLKVSYIPAGMERDDDAGNPTTMGKYLKDVAHQDYGTKIQHRYMVNGGIVVRRTAKSTDSKIQGQRSFLFGAMGQGGRGAYALNIGGVDRSNNANVGLDNSNFVSSVPLFETAKGASNTLGYTVGTPQIGRVSVEREKDKAVDLTKGVRYAGFLASGYRSKQLNDAQGKKLNETKLYVYDMLGQEADSGKSEGRKTGEIIAAIDVFEGVGGLSSPTLVDIDFDGVIDVAYAGDYGGNMYRFDLRGKPAEWKASRIFTGDAQKPVTSAPAVSRQSNGKYVVIFGTGSDIYTSDSENKERQSIYGIFDDLSKDAPDAKDGGNDLLEQTLQEGTADGKTAYTLSDNKITQSHKGWKINLKDNGERVVVKPTMILRTAVITARSYEVKKEKISNNGDVCIPETTKTGVTASTMLLAVNADTGGTPNKRTGQVQFIKDASATQAYYAGVRQEGIVSFTFMDTAKLNDSPVTRDGDSGGSGTDQPLNAANTEIPNNRCFSREAVRTLLTNKGESIDVSGRICGIRRLSWREIFF